MVGELPVSETRFAATGGPRAVFVRRPARALSVADFSGQESRRTAVLAIGTALGLAVAGLVLLGLASSVETMDVSAQATAAGPIFLTEDGGGVADRGTVIASACIAGGAFAGPSRPAARCAPGRTGASSVALRAAPGLPL
jgi:hypothetical protein